MSPQQAAAVTNNEKVFPVFAKKLSSNDGETFCNSATKLSTWLSSEKAYYAAARPKIIGLLETAQATLRRQKGGDQNEPIHVATYPPHLTSWVTAYTALIRTVVRFAGMFSETDLHDRLQVLLKTGEINHASASFSSVPPTQHIVPTQQAVGSSSYQWVPQQIKNKPAEPSGAGPSTTVQWVPSHDPVTRIPNHSRPSSRPTSASTMRPSSSLLASAFEGQNPTFFRDLPPPPPTRSLAAVPLASISMPGSIPSVDRTSNITTPKPKGATTDINYPTSVRQGSDTNPVVQSQIPVDMIPTSSDLNTPPTSILPTIPTPSQALSVSSRPRLPPIRIPGRPQPQIVPIIQSTSTTVPIPTTSTQALQPIRLSSFSPIPTPFSASASTATVPATAKKQKTPISEDLAQSDLEWLGTKQRKKDFKPAPVVRKEGKVTSVPEDLALSDLVWLEMKRKKDFEAAYKRSVGAKEGENATISSATVGQWQAVDQPGDAGVRTTSKVGSNSEANNSKPAPNEGDERATTAVSSDSVIKGPPSGIISSGTPETVVLSDRKHTPQPQDVVPMDVDLPPIKTGAGVATLFQAVEQHPRDASTVVPALPAHSESKALGEMQIDDTVVASSGTPAERMKVISARIDSAQTSCQINESALTVDDLSEHMEINGQEPLPAVGGSGERLVNDEKKIGQLQIISEPVDLPVAEGARQNMPGSSRLDSQDNGPIESPVVGETTTHGEVTTANAAEIPQASHDTPTPTMSTSTDDIVLTAISRSLQSAFVDIKNEANDMSPPLAIQDPPNPTNTTSTHACSMSISNSKEISPPADLPLNSHPPTGRKRTRSPSPHADYHSARPRLASRSPFEIITNETIFPQSVKQEGISEMEVMQFLNTVPLGSEASNGNVNGLPKFVTVQAREPRKIEFGPEMVVIAARQGSSSQAINFNFDIDDAKMPLISLWQNWNKIHDDVSQSLCLTLACYHCADLLPEIRKTNGSLSLEELLSTARCSWPVKGGLTVVIEHDPDDWRLPLAPPFHQSSENLVDISQFVKPRKNTVHIHQHSDMSGFVFALHAHFPTRQQLEVVTRRRMKDIQWQDDLKKWSQKVNVPLPAVLRNARTPSK